MNRKRVYCKPTTLRESVVDMVKWQVRGRVVDKDNERFYESLGILLYFVLSTVSV